MFTGANDSSGVPALPTDLGSIILLANGPIRDTDKSIDFGRRRLISRVDGTSLRGNPG